MLLSISEKQVKTKHEEFKVESAKPREEHTHAEFFSFSFSFFPESCVGRKNRERKKSKYKTSSFLNDEGFRQGFLLECTHLHSLCAGLNLHFCMNFGRWQ